MQYFKGDPLEIKMVTVAASLLQNLSSERDLFLAGAYEAAPLGDLISIDKRAPLSNAIKQEIFRTSFKEIFDAFVKVGSFEAYLTVFRKIFGTDVGVVFTVPAAGKLNIDITAAGVELTNFITRYIENNAYVYDTMVDNVGDFIMFQTVKGFQSQYELEQMLFEMVPAGIYTHITLTLG